MSLDPRIAELYDFNPADVRRVIRRYWQLLPEGHGLELPWFAMALLGRLVGMDLRESEETPAEITACADYIEDLLSVEIEPGKGYQVDTMAGAIAGLQYDSLEEHYEAINRIAKSDAPIGVPGPWTCPFCAREWLAGTEPDTCPDCDALLMRATLVEKRKKEGT
jgi:hypothetical protein